MGISTIGNTDAQSRDNDILSTSPGAVGSDEVGVDPAERERRIAEAAYRRAEQRGFEPGAELDDWLCAERDIDGDRPADESSMAR